MRELSQPLSYGALGAAVATVGLFPAAALVALVYGFPVPFAGELRGVQIGVLNWAGNNPAWARILPLVNVHL